jgi:hypothetical protein
MNNATTTLKPRRRLRQVWRRAQWIILPLALLVGLHFGWTKLEQRRLARTIEEYRTAGERILPVDFDQPAVPDADNAVIDLRAAAAPLDERRLNDLCNLEPQLPLSEKESTVIRTTLAAFPDALRLVDSAAGKTGVDWQIHRRTPVIFKHLPDLTPQNHLALLLAADLLSAHEAGDDSRAVRRAQQILFIGRALDRQSTRPSQAYATSIAALAAKRLILIAPDHVCRQCRNRIVDNIPG